MQHFLRTQPPADSTEDLVINQFPTYGEALVRSAVDPKVWFSCYILKSEGDSIVAAVCWEKQFDSVFKDFSNPKYGQIWTDAYRELWPTFFQLIDNAVHGSYEDGALAEMTDPDDMDQKWFFAVRVPGEGPDEIVLPLVNHAINRVVQLGLQANAEFSRQLSWSQKIKVGLRGGAVGGKEGQAIANRWRDRLDWLKPIFGG